MKVTTDPTTGKTTCELQKQDRLTLAAAKTVFEKLAFHLRGSDPGLGATDMANEIGIILEPVEPPEA
uniref:Uncharacterized protein n=1 Tax=viral metagenome TaxID=1070528 RepID=A0A6H1ZP54_9ZZZZ